MNLANGKKQCSMIVYENDILDLDLPLPVVAGLNDAATTSSSSASPAAPITPNNKSKSSSRSPAEGTPLGKKPKTSSPVEDPFFTVLKGFMEIESAGRLKCFEVHIFCKYLT